MLFIYLTFLYFSIYLFGTATAADAHRQGQHRRLSRNHILRTREEIVRSSNHPPAVYRTFGKGTTSPLKKRGTLEQAATAFIESELGLSSDGYRVRASASTTTGGNVWVQRVVNGVPVINAVANVGLNTDKDIIAFGANFDPSAYSTSPPDSPPTQPAISDTAAINAAAAKMAGTYSGLPVKLEYYVQEDGSLTLAYVVVVISTILDEEGEDMHVYETFVDALDPTGRVLGANDFSSGAVYRAVPPRLRDISQQGTTLIVDPVDTYSSPNGWHSANDTSGNNAIVYLNQDITRTAKPSADGLVFDYPYNLTSRPSDGLNPEAAKTAAFYLSNLIHDINYRYGFTEATFNFQQDNFGKGGIGGDRIRVSVQDASAKNNARFTTFPEESGGSGALMQLFVWTRSMPSRDSAVANDIVAHEQTHGTTSRMTGGGTVRCLQTTEANGLSEGWSDAYANWMEQSDGNVKDYVFGAWVNNSPGGLRSYPYSTDPGVNPLKYSSLNYRTAPHDLGEVWANMLHNVYAELVKAYGWTGDSFTNADSPAGNVVFMRNFMDGLLLQPCNPTMLQARDAWIQGDRTRYNGIHVCSIWKAFASRGLGINATNSPTYTDDFTVPDECMDSKASTSSANPTPTQTSSTPACVQTYTSVDRDTCASIETKLGIPPGSVKAMNDFVNCVDIWPWTQLQLPCSPPSLAPTTTSPACAATYATVSGDTCDSIEFNYGLPAGSIKAANSFVTCSDLWTSTTLCIPAGWMGCTRTVRTVGTETCASIGAKYGLSGEQIAGWNAFLNCADIWPNTAVCVDRKSVV